ncbi:NUDIX domain-containing protein [Candidatus Uhrbacteria bacterium]|nr:NUDIX domain-containing protein [Candidatus Uhrbacteria bacterium]
MKTYTVGFIFNSSFARVLLMHKNRPEWQKGKMNGTGGRIEEGEESVACMVREAREETGLSTVPDQWIFLGTIHEPEAVVDFYATIHHGALDAAATCTDEQVEWCDAAQLPKNVLSNIPWLVAYALDRLQHTRKHTFVVQYE